MAVIKAELTEMKNYGDARRTEVIHSDEDITVEDMIRMKRWSLPFSNQGLHQAHIVVRIQNTGQGRGWLERGDHQENDFTEQLFIAQ